LMRLGRPFCSEISEPVLNVLTARIRILRLSKARAAASPPHQRDTRPKNAP
jgi:hypothetical protein